MLTQPAHSAQREPGSALSEKEVTDEEDDETL